MVWVGVLGVKSGGYFPHQVLQWSVFCDKFLPTPPKSIQIIAAVAIDIEPI